MVSVITASEVTDKNRGKGQGEAKKPKNEPDVSAQVAALARVIPNDAKTYFKNSVS